MSLIITYSIIYYLATVPRYGNSHRFTSGHYIDYIEIDITDGTIADYMAPSREAVARTSKILSAVPAFEAENFGSRKKKL